MCSNIDHETITAKSASAGIPYSQGETVYVCETEDGGIGRCAS
jgi:hypothetical protein